LPIPSYARVTNLATGRQVIVRINDRGPFLSERIIDLSYTAALKLGYMNHGSGELEVEKLMPDEIERLAALRKGAQSAPAMAENVPAATSPVATPVTLATAVDDKVKATASGWYLQLGAFSQQANAEQARLKVIANWPDLEVEQAKGLYRLYAGPFASRAQAEAAASAAPAGSTTPIIVQR
jgi:rare lipoprotein A